MSANDINLCGGSELINDVVTQIDSADVRIDAVVYKAEHRKVFRALKRASKRGVRIRLLADKYPFENSDSKSFLLCAKFFMLKNVEIRKWPAEKMHAKFTISDKLVLSGSYNWTGRKGKTELVQRHTLKGDRQRFQDLFNYVWKLGKKANIRIL